MRRLIFIIGFFILQSISASAQWGAPYNNSWITNAQPYLKIRISESGIQKLSVSQLSDPFRNADKNRLQLWHRGKQVAVHINENNEIVFYGLVNDGNSDALLYRPYTPERTNPYVSWFSNAGIYFLTIGTQPGLRMPIESTTLDNNVPLEKYHQQTEVIKFTDDYSHSNEVNFYTQSLIQSYFEKGKGLTGKIYGKHKTATHALLLGDFKQNLSFKNVYREDPAAPSSIEVLIYGRSLDNNDVGFQVGKDENTLRTAPESLKSYGFDASKKSFPINIANQANADITPTGDLVFKLVSNNVTDSYRTTGMFSVTYIKSSFPQIPEMGGLGSKTFDFPGKAALLGRVQITHMPSNAMVLNITDPAAPKLLRNWKLTDGTGELMFERKTNTGVQLLVTSDTKEITPSQIQSISFPDIDPERYDYLILTTKSLWSSAQKYNEYRSSAQGGKFKTLLVDIDQVYNQFNFGEPSPVAIRRFVDFMLSKGVRSQHNLLLIGPAIAWGDKFKTNLDLPDQVPSIGPPGSDLLLVDGLAGAPTDVAALPIGRVPATSPELVDHYLNKVKIYEKGSIDIGWKKKILHLSGGKSASEITQLKGALETLTPFVKNGEVGGSVKPFIKQSIIEVEPVDITRDVNEGVGMVSYFGHGSPSVTDLDMGYISDIKKGYKNSGKYPLMYFNGCGVGNIYKGNWNPDLNAPDHIPLSFDWLLADDRGAIAIIANSYYSFLSPSARYVGELYQKLFSEPSASEYSIGKIQQEVARKIRISGNFGEMDMANLHQSVLQGDPALHLIRSAFPDYAVDEEGIILYSESPDKTLGTSKNIKLGVALSNLGKNIKGTDLDIQIKFTYKDGTTNSKALTRPVFAFQDTLFVLFENQGNLQKIEVSLDPAGKIQELNDNNNVGELLVDWNQAKDLKLYPSERVRDVVSPVLNVTFNNRIIPYNAVISPNPTVRFTLTDDRLILNDASLLDIRIKPCGDNSCDYYQLDYSSPEVELTSSTGNQLILDYSPKNWISGTYELLIYSKDKAGNSSSQPYRIKFNISEGSTAVKVSASPNPSSTGYVKFAVTGVNPKSILSGNIKIYDARGAKHFDYDLLPGEATWDWIPKVSSGVYFYKLQFNSKETDITTLHGKVILNQ